MIATPAFQQHQQPPPPHSKLGQPTMITRSPPTRDAFGESRMHTDQREIWREQNAAFQRLYTAPPPTSYIPAALRPTEFTTRPTNIPNYPRAPDTPPQSKGNSFDSANSNTSSERYDVPEEILRQPASEWDMADISRRLLANPSDPLEHVEEEVTGPPVTSHWKPNETSLGCAVCDATFTWYFRRHHCRKCGYVVCGQHSQHVVKLDHNARFHPKGTVSRACDPCHQDYKKFKELRLSRASSLSQSQSLDDSSRPESAATTPTVRVPGSLPAPPVHTATEARSLGFYGNWSTF